MAIHITDDCLATVAILAVRNWDLRGRDRGRGEAESFVLLSLFQTSRQRNFECYYSEALVMKV